jgi:hypothetical protein
MIRFSQLQWRPAQVRKHHECAADIRGLARHFPLTGSKPPLIPHIGLEEQHGASLLAEQNPELGMSGSLLARLSSVKP